MRTNVLVALKNVLECKNRRLSETYQSSAKNKVNGVGDALEYFVKDLFCSTIEINNIDEKKEKHNEYLSYLGSATKPPDFIIRQSAAVEVKKLDGLSFGEIQLNSSYPKDYLLSNSSMIKDECKHCEDQFGGWNKKDMLYAIGNVKEKELRVLWLVDGACYCAASSIYEDCRKHVEDALHKSDKLKFSETKELGRINKVDPLQITNLRVRPMWLLQHPMKVFEDIVEYDQNKNFQVYCLLLKEKYDALPNEDKENLNTYIETGILDLKCVKIKNPNNSEDELDGILFTASLD